MPGLAVKQRAGSYWLQYIYTRMQQNKNFVVAITGQTGSGKSYAALSLAEKADPNFTIENVCFRGRELLHLVNGDGKRLLKGAWVLWDEVQVEQGNLNYQSMQSKMINYVLQTFRFMNITLIVTSPHFSFINAGTRKLFHARMETCGIDFENEQVSLKPLLLQVNQHTGNVYEKFLRVGTKEMGVIPLKRIKVGKATSTLLAQYEAKKSLYTSALYRSISKDLERLEEETRKPLTVLQEQIVKDVIAGKLLKEIALERNISPTDIYAHLKAIKKKGVAIRSVREGRGNNRVVRYVVEGFMPSAPGIIGADVKRKEAVNTTDASEASGSSTMPKEETTEAPPTGGGAES
jgi:DNA-binding CsgD family transcriptional regulator